LEIAQKETRETQYWINLLLDTNYIDKNDFEKLNNLCSELNKILSSIIITTKQKYLTTKTP
jgi:four helix bundle protein